MYKFIKFILIFIVFFMFVNLVRAIMQISKQNIIITKQYEEIVALKTGKFETGEKRWN